MTPLETEKSPRYPDDQMATHRHQSSRETPPSHSASCPGASPECPGRGQTAAGRNAHDLFERAKAQEIDMHGERLARQYRQNLANGAYALRDLSCHMRKSLPYALKASPSTLGRFWFSVHYRVATFVLRQAHRQACRLGLTRVADTKGFLARHCGWYRWYRYFCRISRLFA